MINLIFGEGRPVTPWQRSFRADPRALPLADRHYNRQKVGSPQFVPPGSCLVLLTPDADAVWVTSWPKAEYVKHAWAGAWMNSLFRNESPLLASGLIRAAVVETVEYFGEPPALGMVTFVDRAKVRPTRVRGKDVWGWTYLKAGFVVAGETKGGLLALQLTPEAMPAASRLRSVAEAK